MLAPSTKIAMVIPGKMMLHGATGFRGGGHGEDGWYCHTGCTQHGGGRGAHAQGGCPVEERSTIDGVVAHVGEQGLDRVSAQHEFLYYDEMTRWS
jgi:hypothetical protein